MVGADVGETRVLVELYDLAMSRLGVASYRSRTAATTSRRRPGCWRASPRSLAEAGVDVGEVLGYGVGVAGVVDQSGGDAVVHSQTTGWDAVPLGALLRAGTEVPVFVENGAKTVGQAEMWFGAGRGAPGTR